MFSSPTQLPPPVDWQGFERLCHLLWKELWQDPDAKMHGRSGQKQFGVDVFGCPNRGCQYEGIQCKGKESFADKMLTHEELKREISKAEEFEPGLSHFIIATTGQRDAVLQKAVREISLERKKEDKFSVDVFFWEDIREELCRRPDICKVLYPQAFQHQSIQAGLRISGQATRGFNEDFVIKFRIVNEGEKTIHGASVSLQVDSRIASGKAGARGRFEMDRTKWKLDSNLNVMHIHPQTEPVYCTMVSESAMFPGTSLPLCTLVYFGDPYGFNVVDAVFDVKADNQPPQNLKVTLGRVAIVNQDEVIAGPSSTAS